MRGKKKTAGKKVTMPAPKGNKNAVGNNGGRPALFDSPKALQEMIDQYFADAPDKRTVPFGNGSVEIPVFTISGLAYYLGFESRQSFYDYEKHIEYSYLIKRARLRIEGNYEQNLHFSNATGSIFALKNMGWVDKQEIDTTLNIPSLPDIIIK